MDEVKATYAPKDRETNAKNLRSALLSAAAIAQNMPTSGDWDEDDLEFLECDLRLARRSLDALFELFHAGK